MSLAVFHAFVCNHCKFFRHPTKIYLHLAFRPRIIYAQLSSFENNIIALSRHLVSTLEKFRSNISKNRIP
ncbi:hypothetical protein WN943_019270 [Citrus x changshan-huyou]